MDEERTDRRAGQSHALECTRAPSVRRAIFPFAVENPSPRAFIFCRRRRCGACYARRMAGPFRDDAPAVEAALSQAEAVRAADAAAAMKQRRRRALYVVLGVAALLVVGAVVYVGYIFLVIYFQAMSIG